MRHLVGLGLAFVELLEAEGARLKLNARQVMTTGALLLIGALVFGALLSTASGLLLWAAFLALRPAVGAALAALILGSALWILVGGATWLVASRLRRS